MNRKLLFIINSAKATIPSVDTILEAAWQKLKLNRKIVATSFGTALVCMDEEGTKIFKKYEKQALIELAKAWLKSQKNEIRQKFRRIVMQQGWDSFIEEASQLFVEFGTLVQRFEKDLGNMRKARGGKGFVCAKQRVLALVSDLSACNAQARSLTWVKANHQPNIKFHTYEGNQVGEAGRRELSWL